MRELNLSFKKVAESREHRSLRLCKVFLKFLEKVEGYISVNKLENLFYPKKTKRYEAQKPLTDFGFSFYKSYESYNCRFFSYKSKDEVSFRIHKRDIREIKKVVVETITKLSGPKETYFSSNGYYLYRAMEEEFSGELTEQDFREKKDLLIMTILKLGEQLQKTTFDHGRDS